MKVLLSLIEAMSVFLVVSYIYCWSPALPPLKAEPLRRRNKLNLFVFFTLVSIMGTYLGIPVAGAIANTRAVGSVLAGLIGGPLLGVAVGATAGVHRVWIGGQIGGMTALSGAVGTTVEGLLGGLIHLALMRRNPQQLTSWSTAAAVTALGECIHMGIVLLLSRPFPEALESVRVIALPMIISNTIGSALFMTVLRERQEVYDEVSAASSAFALRVAERTLGILAKGFNRQAAVEIAEIIREETGVGAVAITDRESVLAFTGLGSDHHSAGRPISSPLTQRAISEHAAIFADGAHEQFTCRLSSSCPLASVVVVPLQVDDHVVGTVQLFEPPARRFRVMNRTLTEGLGALLSNQLVLSRYQEQKSLLVVAELKLLQAQVNPHFLFNSLNTIMAITRTDPERARELLAHLSHFFRKNLKRSHDVSTLKEELDHVGSYLEIEKARFPDRLRVETDVDPTLLDLPLPTFTLQPLIENAVRHGLSRSMNEGKACIRAYRRDGQVLIDIEDDAGTYVAPGKGNGGLGMKIVDKRIKNLLGEQYGVTVHCVPNELTRVTVRLPAGGLGAEQARSGDAARPG